MKASIRVLYLAAGAAVAIQARPQGCSDAGVCSAGPLGQLQLWTDSVADVVDYRHMARLGYTYASGEQGTTIMQALAEISIGIGPRLAIDAKMPYVWASGNLGDNQGLGDAIVTASYAFLKERDGHLTGLLGIRLPTGSTNATATTLYDGQNHIQSAVPLSLPMPYQTGLGTTDLLLGAQYRYKGWTMALALQHVLDQDNKNMFSHEAWSGSPDAVGYFESYYLERADDLVARVQYAYGCGRLSLQPGLLAIQHLGKDSRMEPAGEPVDQMGTYMLERREVDGSEGLTLNVTADLLYKLAERWAVEALFGTPVITREVRPDGLTRSLVTGLALRYRF